MFLLRKKCAHRKSILQETPVQTSDLHKSDWYKRQTQTNFGLRQTSNQYKRRISTNVETSTNVGRVHYKEKRRTLIEFEKMPLL